MAVTRMSEDTWDNLISDMTGKVRKKYIERIKALLRKTDPTLSEFLTDGGTVEIMDPHLGQEYLGRVTKERELTHEDVAMVKDMLQPTQSVGQEAEKIINGPRRDAYGPVEESFKRIALAWEVVLGHPVSVQDVAAMMVLLKVCREIGGNHHRDNLVDICGYTLLWERLEAATQETQE